MERLKGRAAAIGVMLILNCVLKRWRDRFSFELSASKYPKILVFLSNISFFDQLNS
jgi:hypothetical protein